MSEYCLDELCEILDSKRVPLSAMQRAKRQGPYPYYGAQSIIDYVDDYLLDGEYLLVAEDGANLVTRTQNIANLVSGKIWVNNHAHILGYNGKCPLELLGFILNHLNISPYVTGCAQPKLNQDNLRRITIKLPEKVDEVSSFLSFIDDKIAINRRISENLEAQAQALFKHWFIDFAPFKDGKFIDSELGMIPEGWRVGRLEELGDIVGGATPSKAESSYYTSKGIAWLTPKDLSNNLLKFTSRGEIDITQEGYNSCSAKIMPKGSVLFSSRAPIGYLTIAKNDICTNQGFKSVVPRYAGTAFIYYLLKFNTKRIESMSSGTTFKEASGSLMKSLAVIIPPKSLIDDFEASVIEIFNEQEVIEQENLRLAQLRDTLLPKLMSGQIKV